MPAAEEKGFFERAWTGFRETIDVETPDDVSQRPTDASQNSTEAEPLDRSTNGEVQALRELLMIHEQRLAAMEERFAHQQEGIRVLRQKQALTSRRFHPFRAGMVLHGADARADPGEAWQPAAGPEEAEQRESNANLFSYCVRSIIEPESPLEVLRCWVLLLALSVAQTTLVFGFYSSTFLLTIQSFYPGYQDPIDQSLFYPGRLYSSGFKKDGNFDPRLGDTGRPLVNILTSAWAALILGLYLKQDTVSTLLGPHPIEVLLFPPADGAGRGLRAWRALTAVPLQLMWTLRAVTAPSLAAFASAMSFVAAMTAQDIVLNSTAIGFVFELDEYLYAQLVSARERQRHEAKPPFGSTGPVKGMRSPVSLVHFYAWVVYVVDVTAMFSLIIGFPSPAEQRGFVVDCNVQSEEACSIPDVPYTSTNDGIVLLQFVRCAVMTVGHLHLCIRTRLARAPGAPALAIDACKIFFQAALGVCCGFASVNLFDRGLLWPNLGWSRAILDVNMEPDFGGISNFSSDFNAVNCMKNLVDHQTACSQLHTIPGIFDALMAYRRSVGTAKAFQSEFRPLNGFPLFNWY